MDPEILLVTDERCRGERCVSCRQINHLMAQVTASGVDRALHVLHIRSRGPPMRVVHLGCDEIDDLPDSVELPLLTVDEEVLLQGAWTEDQVRDVLQARWRRSPRFVAAWRLEGGYIRRYSPVSPDGEGRARSPSADPAADNRPR